MNYRKLENIGKKTICYGLAIVLIWIGILKFTPYEAEGIKGLVANSPFLSWTYQLFSVEAFARVLGIVEIASGVLILCRSFAPRLAFIGGVAGIVTFIITLTLLVSTPGIIQEGYSFPFISPMPGQFILKDIVLLGAAIFIAGEAMHAMKHQTVLINK